MIKSSARASPILPLETWIKLGIGPRRSSSVCILTAALVERKSAHGNSERHKSIVVLSSAYNGVDEVKTDIVIYIKSARAFDQDGGQSGPYAPITQLIRVGQCRFCHRSAQPHTVQFRGLGSKAGFDIAQALAISHLRERHKAKVFCATKCADANIAAILHNDAFKTRLGNKIHHLREESAAQVHGGAPIEKTKSGKKLPPDANPCSSRHQKKHPRNPHIAALSYKLTRAEPDSSDRPVHVKTLTS